MYYLLKSSFSRLAALAAPLSSGTGALHPDECSACLRHPYVQSPSMVAGRAPQFCLQRSPTASRWLAGALLLLPQLPASWWPNHPDSGRQHGAAAVAMLSSPFQGAALFVQVPVLVLPPTVLCRWDWHVVQFLLAMIPPGRECA